MKKHRLHRLAAWLTAALIAALPSISAAQVVEYYHTDALGSVRAVTNQAGGVIERHDYYAYGEECTEPPCGTQPGTNTKKFTGKERDVETGLDYFGARYYGSRIGRFSTVDPLMELRKNIANPQRWNRYAYALNQPLGFVDPSGESPIIAAAAVGAGIGFTFAFGGSLVSQVIRNGSFDRLDYGEAFTSGAGGALSGALAGVTLGGGAAALGLTFQTTTGGIMAIGAGSNVAGGTLARAIDNDTESRAMDPAAIAVDGAFGAAGGWIGLKVKAAWGSAERAKLNAVSDELGRDLRQGAGNYGTAKFRRGVQFRIDQLTIGADFYGELAASQTGDFLAPVSGATLDRIQDAR
jgi:RHS repeat-associated protein